MAVIRELNLFIFLSVFAQGVFCFNKFCSVLCGNQSCSASITARCNNPCSAPWTWNGLVCQLQSSSGYIQVAKSIDMIDGTIIPNNSLQTRCGCTVSCTSLDWNYTYYGNLSGSQVILFDYISNATLPPHYELRIIFWMILIDNWLTTDQIIVTLQGNYSQQVPSSSKVTSQRLCGNASDSQDFLRFDKNYIHNSSVNAINVSITTNNTGSKWGVKQIVILARICHTNCESCFGSLVSQCYSCISNPLMILSGNTCSSTCLSGYGMTFNVTYCVFCDLRCTACFDLSNNCTSCKSSGTYASYFLPSNFSCLATCPTGTFLNIGDRTCYPCDTSCVSCGIAATRCYECKSTFAWMNYFCYNPCPYRTFLNNGNCTPCSPLCQICQNSTTTCPLCTLNGTNQAFLFNSSCIAQCPTGYYGDNINGIQNQCILCTIPQCLTCISLMSSVMCQLCNASNLYYVNSNFTCSYCDPNNETLHLNGSCTIIVPPPPPIYDIPKFNSIQKNGCNGFLIKLDKSGLNLTNISSNITIQNSQIKLQNIQEDEVKVLIYAEYTKDLINEVINLSTPGGIIQIQYDPVLIPLYYSQSQCQYNQIIKKVVYYSQLVGFSVLILSLVRGKTVGLQLMGVLQISYFILAQHSFLNIYLNPFIDFTFVNGFNIQLISSNNSNLPRSFKQMKVSATFINNVNIMLLGIFGHILLCFILQKFAKKIQSQKLIVLRNNFFKQGLITLMLFNSFNISFSAGVHFRYADPNDQFYQLSTAAMLISVATMIIAALFFIMQCSDKSTYGEFKNIFKQDCVCQAFIPLTIFYRMGLGFIISYKNDTPENILFLLAISLAFVLFTIINLPYQTAYNNYRSCITHISTLFIIFVANYYREIKSETPLEQKSRIYTPTIIQLILISASIVVSALVCVYEIFSFLRDCFKRRKQIDSLDLARKQSNNILNCTEADLH